MTDSDRVDKGPRPAHQTVREAIVEHLRRTRLSVAELSALVGATERDVVDHLTHIERSVEGRPGARFVVDPPRCLACGFDFEGRTRARRPGKCPQCRATRISYPSFSIEG